MEEALQTNICQQEFSGKLLPHVLSSNEKELYYFLLNELNFE